MNTASKKQVTLINYGMGNLHSLQNALTFLNVKSIISSDPEIIKKAEILILPGVGSFKAAMNNLFTSGINQALNEAVINRGIPFLGICLGMQLLAEEGEEDGGSRGLGWIKGKVIKFKNSKLRLPHIGFNSLKQNIPNQPLFADITDNSDFYFVHSFHLKYGTDEDVLGITNYGGNFISAVKKENIYGVQFHPEKSQNNGLKLLSNFIKSSSLI